MLGEFTGENEANGCLDLPGRDGGLLVVGGKLGGLGGDALEDVWLGRLGNGMVDARRRVLTVDERVQDRHGTVGDTGVGVDLLEDCETRSQHEAKTNAPRMHGEGKETRNDSPL